MPKVSQLIEDLKQFYKPDDVIAYDIWCREDVLERASEFSIDITEEQADKIIEDMHENRDAEYGITWDTIDTYLQEEDE